MKKILVLFCSMSSVYATVYDACHFNNHTKAVTAITFDKDGSSIITGSQDGSLCKRGFGKIYEGKTIEGLGRVTHLKRIAQFLAVVHEKCNCGPDVAKHPHPEFYNIKDLTYKSAGAVRSGGHNTPIADMQIINGKSMVTADKEGKLIFLYNCMRSVKMESPRAIPVNKLTVASPSRIIASTGENSLLMFYDPELNIHTIKSLEQSFKIDALAALKHYLLAFTTRDKKIMLLNSKTGADITKILGEHAAEIVEIKKINKRLFVTADKEGVIKVWNAKTGAVQLEFFSSEKSPITALGIHWNKRRQEGKIAVGHQNGMTTAWKYDLEK